MPRAVTRKAESIDVHVCGGLPHNERGKTFCNRQVIGVGSLPQGEGKQG